ncbi:MAG: hypothetical protein IIC81_10885 [Chloroflexi bacterium]|nr:hypothetical protein [Chloroflexota bacterium]
MECACKEFPVGEPVPLKGGRLVINPGGVGQPRDRDPTSSYAIFDDEQGTICHYRAPYDIPFTQEKMRQAGLPERLITRLSHGL